MNGLLADADVRGQVRAIAAACRGRTWGELWSALGIPFHDLEDVGLQSDSPDLLVWQLCQARGLVLITGNRNLDGPDSLEATIRRLGTADSLPVITLSDADRILRDRLYAEDIVAGIIEVALDIERLRGSGRVYLPK